ncbi:hypothetical protein AAC387_Pa03g0912 [Persea americana]
MYAEMLRKGPSLCACLLILFLVWDPSIAIALKSDDGFNLHTLITKEQRRTFASTDFGEISAVDVDGHGGPYHLQFITMEPNSLFLPVLLQADMVFYVDTGSGRIGWVDDRDMYRMDIERGDIYRLESGSIFYVQSDAETPLDKLRIYALFRTGEIGENSQENFPGVYSNLSDLVLGFDKKVLQMTFKVSEDVIEAITNAEKPPSIVHMTAKRRTDDYLSWKAERIEAFSDVDDSQILRDSKRALNIFRRNKDFESSNGWSLAVNYRNLNALKGSNIGVFMVHLNKGSMMGPHWNPKATEIVIVTHGQGMVQLLCSSNAPDCKNTRFKVREGDVFTVPPFHPMAQLSFNSDSLVLMGFTKMERENPAQFLAGKKSVLRNINADILAMSFNVPSTTIRQLLSARREATISACAFCAEEEEEKLVAEIEKQKEEEEAKKRKEEEERKREEEEKKRKEEEEARKREEEERKRKEEEERKRKEEERKKEEEKKRKEEEERKRKEEEEAKERQEEEERKRKEEEEAKKRQEEEERKRKEEEAKKRQEEEERKRKEEEAKKRQEEEERKRKEEEEAKKRQEEEERKRKEEEEAKTRQEEEERKRKEEEEAKKRQEEEERKRKEEEEAKKRQEEEERRRKEEEEAKKRQEEEEKKEEEEARKKKEEEEEAAQKKKEEEEEARKKKEEEARKKKEEEEKGEGGGGLGRIWKIGLLALLLLLMVLFVALFYASSGEGYRRRRSKGRWWLCRMGDEGLEGVQDLAINQVMERNIKGTTSESRALLS